MQVKINPRGNGACPICHYAGRCTIQNKMQSSLKDIQKKEEFEVVVYTCPHFKEKA